MGKFIIDNYNAENASHYVHCRHVVGKSCTSYRQKCIPIKTYSNGKTKIVAFGRLFWKQTEDVKKVRYVSNSKIEPITECQ